MRSSCRRSSRSRPRDNRTANLVESVDAGFQSAQRLLQGLLESFSHGHDFADGLHLRRQAIVRTGKFLKGESRNFRNDIVDRGLEGRGVAPPVMSFLSSSSV